MVTPGDSNTAARTWTYCLARDKVLTERAHIFRDRRPEFYGGLVEVDP